MQEFLKRQLLDAYACPDSSWTNWRYDESTDAVGSFIHKVAVLTAIDSNKCDWVYVAIGTQRSPNVQPELKGVLYFSEGENDDIARVLRRSMALLEMIHPVFIVD